MEEVFEIKKDKYLSKIINFYIFFIPIYYILNILIGEKAHYVFAIIVSLSIIVGIKYFNKFKKKAVIALLSYLGNICILYFL